MKNKVEESTSSVLHIGIGGKSAYECYVISICCMDKNLIHLVAV